MQFRAACVMPGCRRTTRADELGEEWLCNRHFMLASKAARVEYIAAWREADKADKRKVDGLDIPLTPYVRVTEAWDRVKAEALAAAGAAA